MRSAWVSSLLLLLQARVCFGAPNFVLILADDLDWDYKQDRLAIMPNLRTRIRENGVHLINHVAAQPVCGPSRSSLLAGRFPHNVGYLANADPASVAAWKLQENNTIGTWLTAAGYHTAYLGKYVNGMETNVPSGWNHWGGFSSGVGTYNYFNATQWNVTFDATGQQIVGPVSEVIHTGVHQANFVGQQAANQMKAAAKVGRPFFVSVTATMVHYGTCYGPCPGGGASCYAYADPHWENDLTAFGCTNPGVNSGCKMPISPCPSVKHEHDFNNLTNPHVPSWNESESGDESSWMLSKTPLTSYEERRENIGFRNRTAACVDLDDMIGTILDGIAAVNATEETYVIFTSDNGYHLGEHRLVFGKTEPYEHDTRLPFYMSGPGIPPNSTQLHPTTHVDIAATLLDLAGAHATGPPLDGLSFKGALGPSPVPPESWRNFSFSEFFGNNNTWIKVRRPLAASPAGSDFNNVSFHWWCTGTPEVFDLAGDPWELSNLAGATQRGDAVLNATLPLGVALSRCSGPAECNAPEPTTVPQPALPCANVQLGLDLFDP